jgi:hypothetical protein
MALQSTPAGKLALSLTPSGRGAAEEEVDEAPSFEEIDSLPGPLKAALLSMRDDRAQEIDLLSSSIDSHGADILARSLSSGSPSVTFLNLHRNHIGAQGCLSLSRMLATNTTLTDLSIGHNGIGLEGVRHIAEALKRNRTLTALGLRQNALGNPGGEVLVAALRQNTTLVSLGLDENHFGDEMIETLQEVWGDRSDDLDL